MTAHARTTEPSVDRRRWRGRRRAASLSLLGLAGLTAMGWTWLSVGGVEAASPFSGQVSDGVLTVRGSAAADAITLVADSATSVGVDFGADGTIDLSFDRSTFVAISVQGLAGNDTIRISDAGGVFSDTEGTTVDGSAGDDTLLGGSGSEVLMGGGGDDFVDGNRGNDVELLGGGNDIAQWDPGDGSDTIEGDAGTDAMRFNGANINETIDVSGNGSRVRFTRDVAAITMDLNGVEDVGFNAFGGADTVNVHDLSGTTARNVNVDLAAFGGGGDAAADIVNVDGRNSADVVSVVPAPPAARVDGLPVATSVQGGEPTLDRLVVKGLGGDDQLRATPAVGAFIGAVLDGGDATDTVTVDGTNGNDTFGIAPNGTQAAVFDLAGNAFFLTADETVRLNGLGGDDTITGQNGLATLIPLLTLDGGTGNDHLLGGDGNDLILGGAGNDFVDGNRGFDTELLGEGNDTAQWDPGDANDTVEGQDGNDALAFNGSNANERIDVAPNGARVRLTRDVAAITMDLNSVEDIGVRALGGTDVVTVNDLTGSSARTVAVDLTGFDGLGDAALDQVIVNGTAADDALTVIGAAPATTVTGLAVQPFVTGAEAGDTMLVNPLGGNDTVEVRPGAALASPVIADSPGVDSVFTNGSNAADQFTIVPNGTVARVVNGANAFFEVGPVEKLTINGLGGNDTMTGLNGLATLLPQLVLDGGSGNDTLLGGDGNDLILGGVGNDFVDGNRGNDTELLGAGADTAQWDPGDANDTIEGDIGLDTLVFNGSNANENINISPNGSRARLTRDIANITMDLNGVETIDVHTLAGTDNVNVNDLAGTGVRKVNVNLNGFDGGDDVQADQVTVNGTPNVDKFKVAGSGTSATVTGLAADVSVIGAHHANDQLNIFTGLGNDTVDFSGLAANVIQLWIDGTFIS